MKLLILIPLVGMIYEDFKYRGIHWYWLVWMAIWVYQFYAIPSFWFKWNGLFLLTQLALLKLYFTIKDGKQISLTKAYLGIGDILFMMVLALLFPLENLILFLVLSSLLILIGFGIYKHIKKRLETIPLAGAMSFFLCLLVVIDYLVEINVFQHQWKMELVHLLL